MKYKFIISRLAAEDVKQSFEWYEEKSKQAADDFTIEVEDILEKICDNPKIGKNKHEDCYEVKLKKFPFTIIYLIDKNKKLVIITGVFHHMRDPRSKYRKL